MKLYHRTNYWGIKIKASFDDREPEITDPIIWAQAVRENRDSRWWGCCRRRGKRVVEIKELHFQERYRGDWYLYQIGSYKGDSERHRFYKFALVPRFLDNYSFDTCTKKFSWVYVGTIRSCMARLDLDDLLHPFFRRNYQGAQCYSHVHIAIFMDFIKTVKPIRSKQEKINLCYNNMLLERFESCSECSELEAGSS